MVVEQPPGPAAVEQDIAVYFSPNGGAINAIAENIGRARKTIDVQAFILSTSLIGRPLVEAAGRGVRVRVIFDKRQAERNISWDEELAEAGALVYYDDPSDGGINHNKTMLIDDNIIITGSFNFTRTANEKNVENLVIMRGKRRIAAAYRENFEQRLGVSESRKRR